MQGNQNEPNATFQNPAYERSTAPLVYSIAGGQSGNENADSTEIVFLNPYLIVGVENLLMYAEIQEEQDVTIIIEQDSDGLEPYPWNIPYPMLEPNATSSNASVQMDLSSTTTAINTSTESTTTKSTEAITTTTTTTTAATTLSTLNSEASPSVPLASLPENQ